MAAVSDDDRRRIAELVSEILEIDLENHVAVVQPGVTLHQLDEALRPHVSRVRAQPLLDRSLVQRGANGVRASCSTSGNASPSHAIAR